jgi:hypothetical protein
MFRTRRAAWDEYLEDVLVRLAAKQAELAVSAGEKKEGRSQWELA